MWLEENLGTRINEARTKEAAETCAEIFAVACPLCLTMFEDGLKSLSLEEKYQVMDVAEILAERVATPTTPPKAALTASQTPETTEPSNAETPTNEAVAPENPPA